MKYKDTLYNKNIPIIHKFSFNKKVANVFDDMIERSVPFYTEVLSMCAELCYKFYRPNYCIHDLGCSTGNLVYYLKKKFKNEDYLYMGIDQSKDMLQKAKIKNKGKNISFVQEDIRNISFKNILICVSNYVFQFIKPEDRIALATKIFNALPPGGVLLLSEKIVPQNKEFIQLHHDFKYKKGYSQIEIAQKKEALEKVLIPFSISRYISLLEEIGFVKVESFFQWYNFVSLIAIKKQK